MNKDPHWDDWTWQMQNRIDSLEKLGARMTLTPEEHAGCLFAKNKLSFAVTPYFFDLIDVNDPNCPIRCQVIPREEESHTHVTESLDSLGEDNQSPVKGIIHRYPDRVLFLVTDRCAAYCRYCTRSRLVSNAQHYNFHPNFDKAIQYIRSEKRRVGKECRSR